MQSIEVPADFWAFEAIQKACRAGFLTIQSRSGRQAGSGVVGLTQLRAGGREVRRAAVYRRRLTRVNPTPLPLPLIPKGGPTFPVDGEGVFSGCLQLGNIAVRGYDWGCEQNPNPGGGVAGGRLLMSTRAHAGEGTPVAGALPAL